MTISPITDTSFVARTELQRETTGATAPTPLANDEVSFGDIFAQAIRQANASDAIATQKVDGLARGVNDDLHGTMIATKEADISIKLVGSIRNKLLDAFNELWKTSV